MLENSSLSSYTSSHSIYAPIPLVNARDISHTSFVDNANYIS